MNLLLITHGSRDPRYAASFAALCARLRQDGHRAEVGHLGLCGPDPAGAAAALARGLSADTVAPGRERVVAVPMFLGHGYHVTHDVPAALSTARAVLVGRAAVVAAAPLGPDPLLVEAMESRLRELGVWPGDPEVAVLMASAGSSDPGVRAGMAAAAAWWARSGWHGVTPAYAAGGGPDVAAALASARAAGAAEAVVASYFLAPGHLADRVALAAAGAPMSAPFLTPADADPALVRLVLRRAAQALEPAAAAGGPARHRGQGRAGRTHSVQDASTRARSAARS
ncbi:hypothetical protein KDL01_30395 [Actinospica durhamensis]|uniref:Sirohydrochlorin chelatase n=1 Tax=Actinospica durhamensis TaxID=1508375 RepID=A0A941IRQ9_9ACTN|nr:CbiX/SirB N-terminal domain-containing protein [Actinospica durhamensis]MBR7837629.1 hypothetical protein [Actinospica durhamensis]